MSETVADKVLALQVALTSQVRLLHSEAMELESAIGKLRIDPGEKAELLAGIKSIQQSALSLAPLGRR